MLPKLLKAVASALLLVSVSSAVAQSEGAYPTKPIRWIVPFAPGTTDLLARIVGQKKAREIWFLCDQYDAQQALDMGLVNKVVPLADLESETVQWCRRMLELSPLALRMLKAGLNAVDDGLAGIQQLAGDATLLYYMSEEAQEGRDAYVQKRKPNFSKFPKRP